MGAGGSTRLSPGHATAHQPKYRTFSQTRAHLLGKPGSAPGRNAGGVPAISFQRQAKTFRLPPSTPFHTIEKTLAERSVYEACFHQEVMMVISSCCEPTNRILERLSPGKYGLMQRRPWVSMSMCYPPDKKSDAGSLRGLDDTKRCHRCEPSAGGADGIADQTGL